MRQQVFGSASLALLACALALGCARNNSQLTTCQAEKDQLLSTIANQRDANRTLNDKVASLESRLDQAEKELARAGGTRLSTRPSAAPPADPLAPKLAPTQPLPWRSPASKTDNQPAAGDSRRGEKSTGSVAALLALARRDSRVRYDAAAHAAEVQVPLAFAGATASLTAEDKRQLDELARLLKSAEARDLRIMVAGVPAGKPDAASAVANGDQSTPPAPQLGTSRAKAVADYLDRHGIAQDRLAISSGGSRAQAGHSAGGVQVFLLDPNATAVGFGAGGQSVRR